MNPNIRFPRNGNRPTTFELYQIVPSANSPHSSFRGALSSPLAWYKALQLLTILPIVQSVSSVAGRRVSAQPESDGLQPLALFLHPRRTDWTVGSTEDAQSQLFVFPFPNAGAQRSNETLTLG